MNVQKLLELAGQLVLAGVTNQRGEIEKISAELAAELRHHSNEKDGGACAPPPLTGDKIGFLKFNSQEILKMPTRFRKTFRANGCLVHVRKRTRGKYGADYEARYRRDGYNISVSSTDYEKLKEKFINAVQAADDGTLLPNVPTTFHEFATYFFETFWRRTVAASTYKTEMNRYKNHIRPYFGSVPLKSITPGMCQKLFDDISAKGYGKTLDEVHGRLNQIFDMAVNHGLIKANPLAVTIFTVHEREHGKALTKEEEKHLLAATAGTPYQLMFAVVLYTGLRPNEYATARIESNFIIAVNSKPKTKKIEYKKIPITPILRPYLANVSELHFYAVNRLSEKLHVYLPNHSLKDLRLTFNTRCIECGIDEIARKRFMGHSLGSLGNAYTDLSEEYLTREGNKLNY